MRFERVWDDADWYALFGATQFGLPEGTASEWLFAVNAIRKKQSWTERRLGVCRGWAWCEIYSPRNATGLDDRFTLFDEEAEAFCQMVEAELARHDAGLVGGLGI